MVSEAEIRPYLQELVRTNPPTVRSQLSRGDLVHKSAGLLYEIDESGISTIFGSFPQAYGNIYRGLASSPAEVYRLFKQCGAQKGRNIVLPFSRVVGAGVGECLEKAVLAQLAAQQNMESYLVSGSSRKDDYEEGLIEPHAFNIMPINGMLHIIDVENPLHVCEDGKVRPYVAPIAGISPDRKLQVPEEYRFGRTYLLW